MLCLEVVLLGASLVFIVSPPLALLWPGLAPVLFFNQVYLLTPLNIVAISLAGVALLVLSLSLLGGLSRGWAFLCVALLTDYGEGAQAQLEVQALRQGARTIAYHGDLPSTLSELLAQGVQATTAQGGLVWQNDAALVTRGLESGSESEFSNQFADWRAQAGLNLRPSQVFCIGVAPPLPRRGEPCFRWL